MALVDDVLKGGNLVTGLAVGAAAVIGWPLVIPLLRPLAKTAVKGGILAYREATRMSAGTVRALGDLANEAIEETRLDLVQDVAEEAVEEVGAEVVKDAL
jgi:hypothetical protein